MRSLTKDEPAPGGVDQTPVIPPSNLDQVVAADHLQFKTINDTDVTVLGWPKEGSPTSQGEWIKDHSDHGCLYFEVQKVGH